MRKILTSLVLAALWLSPAVAGQVTLLGAGKVSAGGSGCSQATTYVARLTSPSGSDITNITTLICGLVTDGLIDGDLVAIGSGGTGCGTYFDRIWVPAQGTSTNAALDICGNASITPQGSPTFTAYQGWTSVENSTTIYLETNFNPSSGTPKYSTNSNHMSAWVNNNVASSANQGWIMGLTKTTATASYNFIVPRSPGNNFNSLTTGGANTAIAALLSDSSGLSLANRTGASAIESFRNAISQGTGSTAAAAAPNGTFALNAYYNIDTTQRLGGCNGCIASFFSIGAGLSGTQITNLYGRVGTYRTAVGL